MYLYSVLTLEWSLSRMYSFYYICLSTLKNLVRLSSGISAADGKIEVNLVSMSLWVIFLFSVSHSFYDFIFDILQCHSAVSKWGSVFIYSAWHLVYTSSLRTHHLSSILSHFLFEYCLAMSFLVPLEV